ncbi:hypothetical protein IscW_ISCW022664 [Ixodes scapularis]|uniref:Uncharacterized protein n=1 Tax=Ixodes scapularis TaxID=6945 RepID=B7QF82_IXOSC|nr:hypothetical protein IscW_ISCW022664 [Ixodes scapularis]|eukprot:XP_002414196.1 hypothetical protein IscW_ISCW022664 [Ixodes scapularis]
MCGDLFHCDNTGEHFPKVSPSHNFINQRMHLEPPDRLQFGRRTIILAPFAHSLFSISPFRVSSQSKFVGTGCFTNFRTPAIDHHIQAPIIPYGFLTLELTIKPFSFVYQQKYFLKKGKKRGVEANVGSEK